MIRAETEITLSRVDDGANGATFTPSVDASGDISWTNDKGLPNPATQNIKGPAGDDANIWTTSTAPTTPNDTFTISNLTGGSGSVKVGDIILYSYYRYTVTSVSTTTVLAGSRTSLRGATGTAGKWYTGTGITGTSTTATIFSGSGVSSAVVGDMYLNTSTNNTYRCTTAGNASTAKWVYVCNIEGDAGTGVTISSTSISYVVSNQGTSAPSTGWQSTVPAAAAGEYIWTRTIVNYSDGSSTTSYSVARQGEDTTSAYVQYIDATYGVRVYSASGNPNNYVQVSPNSMSVWKGGVQVASFGDTAVIGRNASGYSRIEINSGGMDIYTPYGQATPLAHIGTDYFTFGGRASGSSNGSLSFAGGHQVIASGNYSHAEGDHTNAVGYASHAEGEYTEANNTGTHAQGDHTSAEVYYQTVIGTYNKLDSTSGPTTHPGGNNNYGRYGFILGNGTTSSRSNAFAVTWSGIVEFGSPSGTFVVEPYPVFSNTTINGGSTKSATPSLSKAGYYPVGIVGFTLSSAYLSMVEMYLTNQGAGSATFNYKVKNFSSNNATGASFDAYILWVKYA